MFLKWESQNSLGIEAFHIGVSEQSFDILILLNDTQHSFPKMQNSKREWASRLKRHIFTYGCSSTSPYKRHSTNQSVSSEKQDPHFPVHCNSMGTQRVPPHTLGFSHLREKSSCLDRTQGQTSPLCALCQLLKAYIMTATPT